jgi:hypothetical protein
MILEASLKKTFIFGGSFVNEMRNFSRTFLQTSIEFDVVHSSYIIHSDDLLQFHPWSIGLKPLKYGPLPVSTT